MEINKGRLESRSIRTAALTGEQIGFPLAEQGALILRQVPGRKDELVALVSSAPPDKLPAQKWLQLNRLAWGIESGTHQRLDLPTGRQASRTTMIGVAFAVPMAFGSWGCSGV